MNDAIKHHILIYQGIPFSYCSQGLIAARYGKEKKIKQIEKMNYIFFSVILVLSVFFWYYVAVFAAVFYNTQLYVIYGVIASIVFYFIMLIIIAAITVLVRLTSVKFDIKIIFTINKYIEIN